MGLVKLILHNALKDQPKKWQVKQTGYAILHNYEFVLSMVLL